MPTSFQMPQFNGNDVVVARGVAGLGERVEEGVGGDVVDLADRGGDGAGGREDDEQVEVVGSVTSSSTSVP